MTARRVLLAGLAAVALVAAAWAFIALMFAL